MSRPAACRVLDVLSAAAISLWLTGTVMFAALCALRAWHGFLEGLSVASILAAGICAMTALAVLMPAVMAKRRGALR